MLSKVEAILYVVNQETPNTNVSATPKNIRKQENIKLPVYAVNPKTPSVVWSQFIQINKPSKNTKKAPMTFFIFCEALFFIPLNSLSLTICSFLLYEECRSSAILLFMEYLPLSI